MDVILNQKINKKVDKVTGMGLSKHDFDDTAKTAVEQMIALDNSLTLNGTVVSLTNYAVGNKVIYTPSVTTTKLVATGKNILNPLDITLPTNMTKTVVGNTITIVNNNGYGAGGAITLFLAAGTYTLSSSDCFGLAVRTTGGGYLWGVSAGTNRTVTFTITTSGNYKIDFSLNASTTDTIVDLMLNVGTTKLAWVEAKTTASYLIGADVIANDVIMCDGGSTTIKYRLTADASSNPLNSKIIAFDGDSICCASTAGVVGYPKLIADRNSMTYTNYGVDGGTIAYYPTKHCISRNVPSMRADADYVIFQGGINDYWLVVPMGTISTGYSAALDDTTFCGGFEAMLKQAILKWQGKKIGFIVTHRCYNTVNSVPYWDKAREICLKWSVPFLDLYKESGLCYDLQEIRTGFSTSTASDGVHPNLAGYNVLVPKIEAWLKTL